MIGRPTQIHQCDWTTLQLGANPNATDRWGFTPLAEAVKSGNSLLVETVRAAGGTIQTRVVNELLWEASEQGNVRMLQLLVMCGVDLDAQDYDGRTALHRAASNAQLFAVSCLLSNSAAGGPFRYSIVPSFHYSIVPLFHRSIIPSFHCSIVPLFHRSIVPLFHCSIVPLFHCSIVPLFHCSIVLLFYCSIVPLFH